MGYVWEERTQERGQAVSTGMKKKNIGRRLYKRSEDKKKQKRAEKEDDKPIVEGHDSEDDSDELPDVQL